MPRLLKLAIFVSTVSVSWALTVDAANKTWTSPVNGSWSTGVRWASGVPTATDSATFNQAGTYTVNFASVFQGLNDMFVSAGTVTFERTATPATLLITDTSGGQDLTISGATLNLGQVGPVNLTVGDLTMIGAAGTLNVRAGSFLNTLNLQVIAGTTGGLTISGGGTVSSNFVSLGSFNGTTGLGTVTGAGSALTNSGILRVGTSGTANLTVENGGHVSGADDFIGYTEHAMGTVLVTGAGSYWNSSANLTVGRDEGTGGLRIDNGGSVYSRLAKIADGRRTIGTVSVTGPGSSWFVDGTLEIGTSSSAHGDLTVADGGSFLSVGVLTLGSGSTINVGVGGVAGRLSPYVLTNNGTLNYNHTDAVVQNTPISGDGHITKIGGRGDTTLVDVSGFTGSYSAQGGRLIITGDANGNGYVASNGGTIRFAGGSVPLNQTSLQAAATGAFEYESAIARNGYLRGPGTHTILPGTSVTSFDIVTTYNTTNIVQNGTASFNTFTQGGMLTNNAALSLSGGVNASTGVINVNNTVLTGDFGNNGVINVNNGGVLSNNLGNLVSGGGSRITINSGGTVVLLDGSQLDLNGALLVNNGEINGTVNVNYGSLAKGTGTYDVVNVNTGGIYAPGNSPGISTATALSFDNTVVTSGAATLAIELGGTAPGTQYDQVHITGNLSLGGALQVSLINNLTPLAGQTFDILDWGSLSGTFATINLPTLAGLTWNLGQLYTTGELSVGIAGDYNNNGTVDAADFVVWRKGLGTIYTQNDYNVWRANFGAVAGLGSDSKSREAQASVPEPATLVLFALGAIYLLAARNVRRSRCLSILFGVAVSVSSVSAWADILYVAPYDYPSEIKKVSPAGEVSVFATLPPDSFYPEGLAFDVSGNLYVANDSSGRISKISPSGTASLFATVASLPVSLAFDVSGNLYVVNNGRDQIDKITPSGTVSFFAALPAGSNAISLAFDSSGNLYVAGSNVNQISKIASSGTSSIFVTLPSDSSPWALAFDGSGNLFLADSGGRIDKISPGGAVSPFVTLPDHPYGLAFDSIGNLYASQYGLGQISKITPAGAVSIFASGIVSPTFIAVTDDAGHPLSLPPATLLGDYNRNSTIDAADYVVWRDGLNTTYSQNDYDVWRSHFGQTAGSSATNAVVPEPTIMVLLMLAATGCCLSRMRIECTARCCGYVICRVSKRVITVVVAILAIFGCHRHAHASTYSWARTTPGTHSWTLPANWGLTTGFPNAFSDIANLTNNITGPQVENLNQQIVLGTLNLGSAGNFNSFTVAGNGGSIYFYNGLLNSRLNVTGPISHFISANVTLASNLDIQTANGFVTLSGNLSGSGALSNTSGNVTLSGINSYAGGTVLNSGGGVIISSDANLGAAAGGIAFGTGFLQVLSDIVTSRNITIANRADIYPAGHTLTLSGIISGAGALSDRGDLGGGTIVLTGANTYGGGTIINDSSRLLISADSNLGAAGTHISIARGFLDVMGTFGTNRPISLSGSSGGAVLNVRPGFTLTENGSITGPASVQFQIQGGGALVLGGVNTYAGGTLINQTGVTISADANFGAAGGAVRMIDGTISSTANITTSRILTLEGTSTTFNVSSGTTLTTASGAIGGTGSLTKLGTGTLVLRGSNSFSGTQAGAILFLRDGTVSVASDTALGAANGKIVLLGTLQTTANFTTNRSIVLGGASNFFNVATGTTLTLGGVVSGFGGLNKNGNGTLIINGGHTFTEGIKISGGAVILVDPNSLPAGSAVANDATLNVNANTTAGSVTGLGTTVVAAGVVLTADNFSQAAFTNNGNTTISGTMTNNGSLILAAGSTLTCDGNFLGSQGSLGPGLATFNQSLAPGSNVGAFASLEFGGDVTLSANNTLSIELANGPTGAKSDEVHVSGQIALAGALQVTSIVGFAPVVGNSFDILDWGSLLGNFASFQLPTLGIGLMWNTSQLYITGVIEVVAAPVTGDYDGNGTVDAADYVVWRKGLGSTHTQDDYNVWRAHFGQTGGSGTGATANVSVPEPTTLILLTMGVVIMCARRRANVS